MFNPGDYRGIDPAVPLDQHGQTGVLRDVVGLMIEYEAQYHRKGWDNTPVTMYSICRAQDGVYHIGRHECGRLGMHPRRELAFLAKSMENVAPPPGILEDLYPFPLIGHMIIFESWATDLARHEREGRMIADIPGSVEMRSAMAIVGRRNLKVERVRGREPLFSQWNTGDTAVQAGGIHDSLIRIDQAAHQLLSNQGG